MNFLSIMDHIVYSILYQICFSSHYIWTFSMSQFKSGSKVFTFIYCIIFHSMGLSQHWSILLSVGSSARWGLERIWYNVFLLLTPHESRMTASSSSCSSHHNSWCWGFLNVRSAWVVRIVKAIKNEQFYPQTTVS